MGCVQYVEIVGNKPLYIVLSAQKSDKNRIVISL